MNIKNNIMSAQRGHSALGGKKILVLLFLLFFPFYLAQAGELSERLKGRILLQVEDNGEAWYVNPESQKRFYLGRPADAFRVMRELGLGVSDKDFNSFGESAPERLAGKILLKVEDNGQAYYVNPVDLKMHYLGRPQDAFDVMRNLGLGIANNNLDLVEIDEQSSPVLAEATEAVVEIEEVIEEEVVEEDIATTTEEAIEETGEETATSTEEVVVEDSEETATSSCLWLAQYFNNYKLIGSPTATSSVGVIDFNWERGGPAEITNTDKFSARFTANCYFKEGNYEFKTVFDDAIKVYFDGVNFIQSWVDNNKERIIYRERNIEEGEHEVRVEYYEATGNAKLQVSWEKVN